MENRVELSLRTYFITRLVSQPFCASLREGGGGGAINRPHSLNLPRFPGSVPWATKGTNVRNELFKIIKLFNKKNSI